MKDSPVSAGASTNNLPQKSLPAAKGKPDYVDIDVDVIVYVDVNVHVIVNDDVNDHVNVYGSLSP